MPCCNKRLMICVALSAAQFVQAEVITDGSAGAIVSQPSGNYMISQDMGTTVGNNLFHSFQSFNVYAGEAAQFTGNASIANVINRVTGGTGSTIAGEIHSSVGYQGFYLINPAGVVFNDTASVNVPGSFYVSTAQQLIFANGDVLASDGNTSTFSSATPQSFGFVANQGANIQLSGSQLSVSEGKQIALSADQVSLDGSRLTANAGKITIISNGGQNQHIDIDNLNAPLNAGVVSLSNNSYLDVRGDGGGDVYLQAGDLNIDGSTITADNNGNQTGHSQLTFKANQLSLNQGVIDADVMGAGDGSSVMIDVVRQTQLNNASSISMIAQGDSSGNSGNIQINSPEFSLQGRSIISTSTYGAGKGGDIRIVSDSVLLDGYDATGIGAGVEISTSALSKAEVGRVNGEPAVVITSATGNSGNISIDANKVDIIRTAQVSSSTFAEGDAGKITINAQQLTLDSQSYAGDIEQQGQALITGLFSNASNYEKTNIVLGFDANSGTIQRENAKVIAKGNAGSIELNTDTLDIMQTAQISSSTFGDGDAGSIQVNSRLTNIDSLGLVANSTGLLTTAEADSSGNAGMIQLTGDQLNINNAGLIQSSSASIGQAGSIILNLKQLSLNNLALISVLGKDIDPNASQIITPSINISAQRLDMKGQSNISAQSNGSASGGAITIDSTDTVRVSSQSQISSEAENSNSGTVSLYAPSLLLDDGLVTTSVGRLVDGQPVIYGDGGNIVLGVNSIIMSGGFVQANTQGVAGHGGAILIDSNQVVSAYNQLEVGGGQPRDFLSNRGMNIIQAAAPEGAPGEITITSPIDNMTALVQAVDSSFKSAPQIADSPCQLEKGEIPSSLILTGHGSLPQKASDDVIVRPHRTVSANAQVIQTASSSHHVVCSRPL